MENIPISPVSVEVFSILSKAFGMAAGDRVSALSIEEPSRRSRSLAGRRRVVEVDWLLLNTRSRFLRGLGLERESIVHAITLGGGQEKMCGNRRIAEPKENGLGRTCLMNLVPLG
jgi:hypothetical protein